MTLTFTVRRLLKADRLLLYSGSSLPSRKVWSRKEGGWRKQSPAAWAHRGRGVSCTLGCRGHIYNWHPLLSFRSRKSVLCRNSSGRVKSTLHQVRCILRVNWSMVAHIFPTQPSPPAAPGIYNIKYFRSCDLKCTCDRRGNQWNCP